MANIAAYAAHRAAIQKISRKIQKIFIPVNFYCKEKFMITYLQTNSSHTDEKGEWWVLQLNHSIIFPNICLPEKGYD